MHTYIYYFPLNGTHLYNTQNSHVGFCTSRITATAWNLLICRMIQKENQIVADVWNSQLTKAISMKKSSSAPAPTTSRSAHVHVVLVNNRKVVVFLTF